MKPFRASHCALNSFVLIGKGEGVTALTADGNFLPRLETTVSVSDKQNCLIPLFELTQSTFRFTYIPFKYTASKHIISLITASSENRGPDIAPVKMFNKI